MEKTSNRKKAEWLKPYHFKPGLPSANPKGRDYTLANRIKQLTSDGIELADVMIKIMRGQKIEGIYGKPSYKDVREATMWLAEQVFGRAPIKIDAETDGSGQDLITLIYLQLRKQSDPASRDLTMSHVIDVGPSDPPTNP